MNWLTKSSRTSNLTAIFPSKSTVTAEMLLQRKLKTSGSEMLPEVFSYACAIYFTTTKNTKTHETYRV